MSNRKIGVIADDFTGAGDAASMLKKSGQRVFLYTAVPQKAPADFDAVVIASKTRSVTPDQAVFEIEQILDFFNKIGITTIYFKYCSTFDSTPKGNIGVISDYLLETLDVPYTVLCPSFPENGRTVMEGHLYVDGVPLDQSPLRNHPLNPMWSSSIRELMKPQSQYPCYTVNMDTINQETIEEWKKRSRHFYLIPNYQNDQDAIKIANYFKDLRVLTGGSALLEFILDRKNSKEEVRRIHSQNSVILCGSCSTQTRIQIQYFKKNGGTLFPVSASQLSAQEMDVEKAGEFILNAKVPVLLYSDAVEKDMSVLRTKQGFESDAKIMEEFMSELARFCLEKQFDRIVVAGGETSGAVLKRLGFEQFTVGQSIAPGVPALIPHPSLDLCLILKSGNFGQDDFFIRALEDVYV